MKRTEEEPGTLPPPQPSSDHLTDPLSDDLSDPLQLDVETWNPKADDGSGGWQSAYGDVDSDERNFHLADSSQEEINQEAIGNGSKSLEQILAVPLAGIQSINPKSEVPRNILKTALGQNWKYAKDQLAHHKASTNTEDHPKLDALMLKLWEFRQWDHVEVLSWVQGKLGGESALSFSASGSVSPTSDIDVNLAGSRTEEAVPLFNQRFKSLGGWSYESGVVYDVNVYCRDMIWDKKGTLGRTATGDELNEVVGEGRREGVETGGVNPEDAETRAQDTANQDIWSLVHLRRYMNETEWSAYKTEIDPDGQRADDFTAAETRHRAWQESCVAKMLEIQGEEVTEDAIISQVDEMTAQDLSGEQGLEHLAQALTADEDVSDVQNEAATDDLMIAASNRIYEEKMARIAKLREGLAAKISLYNEGRRGGTFGQLQADFLEPQINEDLRDLRDLVSEAIMYANEVYVTSAAINHAVLGVQIGRGITQSNAELMQVVTENLGDVYKVLGSESTLHAAAFGAGKYMFRLGEAAMAMEIADGDVQATRKMGWELSERLKNALDVDHTQDDTEKAGTDGYDARGRKRFEGSKQAETLRVVKIHYNVGPGPDGVGQAGDDTSGINALKAKITKVAAEIAKAYDASHRGQASSEALASRSDSKQATSELV